MQNKTKQKTTKTTMAYHFIPTKLQRFRSLTIPVTKYHENTQENPQSRTPNKCYRSGEDFLAPADTIRYSFR